MSTAVATRPRVSRTQATAASATASGLHAQLPAADLAREVSFVSQVIARRPTVPALAGVMLTAEHGGLRLTGHDFEISATTTLPAAGATGQALLPAGQLLKMLRAIARADVTIHTDDTTARISGAGVEYQVPVLPADQWPQPHGGADHLVAILPPTARNRLRRTLVALGADTTLPILTSVNLHVLDGSLAAACTDRYRLALADALAPALAADSGGWNLPGRAAHLAMRFLPATDDLHLSVSAEPATAAAPQRRTSARPAGLMRLDAGPRSITAALTDGEFPKVRTLIPDAPAWSATFDRLDLLTALRQVTVVADKTPVRLTPQPGQAAVRLHINDHAINEATLTAQERAAVSTAHKDVAAADVDGDLVAAAFTPAYLEDGLLAARGDAVTVVGTLPTKPIVISSTDEPGTQYLLMPVRMAG